MVRRLTRSCGRLRLEAGFTLIELIVTMALMLIVLTAVSATFVSGTHSETAATNRIRGESDARQALSKMRDDLHCAFAVTSITQNSMGGFTLTLTEFYNTCAAIDQHPGSGSKVLLSWCTIPSTTNPGTFELYRQNTTCDSSGTRVVASDIVSPAAGWPQNTAATGVGGSGTPSSWAGNIWPTTPTCQLGYLQTQVVDMAVNPNYKNDPTNRYELRDQIALRNSTRCGTGTGDLAGPSLTVSAPALSAKGTPITPSATVSGSSNESAPITFYYWKQASAPTDCMTGGTSVGTASTAGDGNYSSSLSYTPNTAGDHIWWYASMSADSNNIAVVSTCGASMPMTTVTNGPASPTLSVSAPATASKGIAIPNTSIGGALSGSSGAVTGGITFKYIVQAAAPASCGGAGWTTLGTANPTGDGTWNPTSGYTPVSTTKIWWYATFAGDANDSAAQSACGASMPSTTVSLPTPTLTVSAPISGTKNTPIATSALTATLAGSASGTAAAIKLFVSGPSASAPGTCTGAGWTQVGGSITPAGDGSYHPTATYTPLSSGTYWWYATYAGDANNNATNSTCGGSMASTIVNLPDTFSFAAIGTKTAGAAFTVTITANLAAGGTDTSYTGTRTITFTGPGTAPGGNAPSYPATVTFVNGVSSPLPSITLYKKETTTLTATDAAIPTITGTSNSFTVQAAPLTKLMYATSVAGSTQACPTGSVAVGNGGSLVAWVALTDAYGNVGANGNSSVTVTIQLVSGGGNAPNPGTLTVNGNANPSVTSGSSTMKLPNGSPAATTYTATAFGYTSVSCIVSR